MLSEHDPLFYLVYERTPVIKGSLEPHMWGYRPRITLENLTRYMQQQKTKLPILEEFLKEARPLLYICISLVFTHCFSYIRKQVYELHSIYLT